MNRTDRLAWLASLPHVDRRPVLDLLQPEERRELRYFWELWAREEQLSPVGDWLVWLICAGRGFGKTRAGAEWVRRIARDHPDARIALIGASLAEARAIMVEGESGLLAVSPPYRRPVFEPSLRRLSWPSGAQAYLYSAAEPESLRGPQHSHACGTGPERVVRQRGPDPNRHAVAADRRGRGRRAATRSKAWRLLDRERRQRRIRETRK
ncbi:terminase large subunit domain-containing protein [Croceicoccus marinus]|uniref:terminase large subunit domain-containing protein n=1 Tax=Croceicoccus marinus TaxID=450378 RepID=UPI000AC39372